MFRKPGAVCALLTVLAWPLQAEETRDDLLCLDSRPAGLQVCLRSELQPLLLNQLHRWQIHVADSDGLPLADVQINVDGGMPQHNHGLPTAPQVRAAEQPGAYWLEGMRFHMGGEWTLQIELLHAGRRYQATTVVTL